MTIVIDGVIFGLQKVGGISRFWAEILLGLDAHFAKNHSIIALIPKNKNIEWEAIASKLTHIQVYPRLRSRGRRFPWFSKAESAYLSYLAFQIRPAIWHATYYAGFPVWKSSHKLITYLDMIPEKVNCLNKPEHLRKRKTVFAADHILSISHASKKDLLEYWPELASKTTVHYIATTSPKVDSPRTQPYLLFLGNREGYKNFIPVVQLLVKDPRFDHLTFKIVGKATMEERVMIASTQSEKRFEFVAHQEKSDIARMIAEATALLYPSVYEGFGLPVLEAFQQNIPVLASRSSSICELAGPNYPLADPHNLSSYATTLSKLLQEREKWVNEGKKRALLFTVPSMVQNLTQLYTKLLQHE